MPVVTYIDHGGAEQAVDVPVGVSVMEGAINNDVAGIVGECGGGLACATCHCYVDPAWAERAGAPSQAEVDMLEAASSERLPTSRLSCQIIVTDALDGFTVRLPETQY